MDRQFKLTPDQFEIDSDGKLVIASDQIADGVVQMQSADVTPPEEAVKITIEF